MRGRNLGFGTETGRNEVCFDVLDQVENLARALGGGAALVREGGKRLNSTGFSRQVGYGCTCAFF